MDCEMCGKETAVAKATIEGSILSVCGACSSYGKVVGRISLPTSRKEKPVVAEEPETVVSNAGQLLKQKREALGMDHADFARKIAVKESVLHKLEIGTFSPGIAEAIRIGRLIGLKLVERVQVAEQAVQEHKNYQLTLGDMIKIRKR